MTFKGDINYSCKSLFLLNKLFVRIIFGCVAATVCHVNCGHLSVLLAMTVQNMWELQLYFNTVIWQYKEVLSFQQRHKSSRDGTVSIFLFSASKANYIDTASQVAVFNLAFCGVCVVGLVRQCRNNRKAT